MKVYIETFSSYENRFVRADIVKQTKTSILACTPSGIETMFTKRSDGRFEEKGNTSKYWRRLRFDTEDVLKILSDRETRNIRQQKSNVVAQELFKAISKRRCGNGLYNLTDFQIKNFETALELIKQ